MTLFYVFILLLSCALGQSEWRNDADCFGRVLLENNNGRIVSHRRITRDNYPDKMECNWLIEAPLNSYILVQSNLFRLEYDAGCNYDYLQVFDGQEETSNVLGRFCGQQNFKVFSTQRTIKLKFHSDSTVNKEGFELRYRFMNRAKADETIAPGVYNISGTCQSWEWRCHNEARCIAKDWLCDHIVDCNNGADESDCPNLSPNCHETQFRCVDKQCISATKWCDGVSDCRDASDEANCTMPLISTQTKAQFLRGSTLPQGRCIGILIDSKHLLVASQCKDLSRGTSVWIVTAAEDKGLTTLRVVINQTADSISVNGDFALIKFSVDIAPTMTFKISNWSRTAAVPGAECTAAGLGQAPNQVKEMPVTVVPWEKCQSLSTNSTLPSQTICLLRRRIKEEAKGCELSEGSLLLCKEKSGEYVLSGTVHSEHKCDNCLCSLADVSAYTKWILKSMGE